MLLADTHVVIRWLAERRKLSRGQRLALSKVNVGNPLLVSDISLWEIAMLHYKGHISLTLPLRDWLERAVAPPLVQVCAITPAIAAEVADLPEAFHGDPADRIIVATARVHGARLLTSDQRIIDSNLVAVQA